MSDVQGQISTKKESSEPVIDAAIVNIDLLPLVEDNADGIAVFDSAGHYLFANREAERILGIPRTKFLGRTLWDVFPTETRVSPFRQQFESAIRERIGAKFNAYSPAISRWLQVRFAPCSVPLTARGDDCGVIVYFRDVTERLEAERSRAESEERFHMLADSAPVLIWMAGLDTHCTWFNRPWLDFTGRTMGQEVGNGWVEGVHPEDLERCLKIYLNAFEERQAFKREHRLRRQDGAWRWLLDNGTPRYDEAGTFVGFIGSCTDITDLKRSEAETERLLAERTILAKRQSELLAQQRAFLKDVLYAVTDGTFLLCDSEADLPAPLSIRDSEVARESLPVSLTTSAALRSLRREAYQTAKRCGLSEESIDDLLTAASEAGMNVVSHTKGQGQACTLCSPEKGIVQVWVEDSGPGIPIDILHRAVLERGWTTRNTLGHGFYMMLHCADRVYLLTGKRSTGKGPGTTVVLEKHRDPLPPQWMERHI